jgi:YgiT-type zinc finger domain-containing protein
VLENRYYFYAPALTEAKKDGITPEDAVFAILAGEVIEEYSRSPESSRLRDVARTHAGARRLRLLAGGSASDRHRVHTRRRPMDQIEGAKVAGMNTTGVDSFDCPECGQQVEDGVVELVFELEDSNVTVKNVPAKVCPRCGQEFVDGYVAENVNRLVDRVVEDVESYAKKTARSRSAPRQIAITA